MITEVYTCPTCGYESRVVAGITCPKCGYTGEWKVDIYAPDLPFCGLKELEGISDTSEGKKRMKKPSGAKRKVSKIK